MKKDIDFYILMKYGGKLNPFLTDEVLWVIASDHLGFRVYDEFVQKYREVTKPKTKFVAHALASVGLSQTKIAELTGISQSSISLHLSKPLDSEWKDTTIHLLMREVGCTI